MKFRSIECPLLTHGLLLLLVSGAIILVLAGAATAVTVVRCPVQDSFSPTSAALGSPQQKAHSSSSGQVNGQTVNLTDPIAPIDLATSFDLRFDGAQPWDRAGTAVSDAGDVNGDGLDDLIVGAQGLAGDPGGAHVIFGGDNDRVTDLANLEHGFAINGTNSEDYVGVSASGAGDVNGDGLDDLIVGGYGVNDFRGAAYVVWGKSDTEEVNLGELGSGGFRIDGEDPFDRAGAAVSGAGDVNGDGRPDLIVGAHSAENGRFWSGTAYVVWGKADSRTVDLGNLRSEGFRIDGAARLAGTGNSVSNIGDMNKDGYDDVIVGAYGDSNRGHESGSAYVLWGKNNGNPIDLKYLNDQGFRVDGENPPDYAGKSVSGAGDVNGDGRPDIIVGAIQASNYSGVTSGVAYVIWGKEDSDVIYLGDLGTQGFRIEGVKYVDYLGDAVSDAGDLNKDGLSDLIVGAKFADFNGRNGSGSAYVVWGKSDTGSIYLGDLAADGFQIGGADTGDEAGYSVSTAGDFNGNGQTDVIVGAEATSNNGRYGSGSAYVIDGGCPGV